MFVTRFHLHPTSCVSFVGASSCNIVSHHRAYRLMPYQLADQQVSSCFIIFFSAIFPTPDEAVVLANDGCPPGGTDTLGLLSVLGRKGLKAFNVELELRIGGCGDGTSSHPSKYFPERNSDFCIGQSTSSSFPPNVNAAPTPISRVLSMPDGLPLAILQIS